jgi:hypothetical protein
VCHKRIKKEKAVVEKAAWKKTIEESIAENGAKNKEGEKEPTTE